MSIRAATVTKPRSWLACLFLLTTLPASAESLVIGFTPALLTGLIEITREQQLFKAEGLDVELVKLPTADDGLRAINEGKIDTYAVGSMTFIKHLVERPDLRVTSSVGEWGNETRIVVRADSGIRSPEDLRGKRVATQHGSSFHYFRDLLMARTGLSEADIEPVFLHTKEQPAALAAGEIDAALIREPYISQAHKLLGTNIRVVTVPGMFIKRFIMVTPEAMLELCPDCQVRMLRALTAGERVVAEQPGYSAQVLAGLGLGAPQAIEAWLKEMRLRTGLDDHLLYRLERGYRWWSATKPIENPATISFLDIIVSEPLLAANPQSVLLRR